MSSLYKDDSNEIATGSYVAGFVDGEGSFNVSLRPRPDYVIPWKVSLCFNVSQKEKHILELVQRVLGCGTLRARGDGVWYFEVNNLRGIRDMVVPFFRRFPFRSEKKQKDFSSFVSIVKIISDNNHLTVSGLSSILRIREGMNGGGKRRYSEQCVLEALKNPQRLYARS